MSGAPGRKRSEGARQAILAAAIALLEEDGFGRFSIEGVASRAKVGKTTIYRWWASKGVLAVEAFLEAAEPSLAFRDSGSAAEDILRQMMALADLYRGPTGRFVREMIGSSQYDPAMRDAFVAGFLEPRRELARAVFRRGASNGEFRSDIDENAAIDAFYGALYYRLLVSGAKIDAQFVRTQVDVVLRGADVA